MAAMLALVSSGGRSMTIVAAQGTCESLVSLALPHTSIASAAVVPEGPVGGGRAGGPAPIVVPARCVVKAVTKPSSDSEIRFEVWLPCRRMERQVSAGGERRVGGIDSDRRRSSLALCAAMRRPVPTMGMRAARGRCGRSVIRRSWWTSVIAPCTRRACSRRRSSRRSTGGSRRRATSSGVRTADARHSWKRSATPTTSTASSPARPANNWTGLMTMALTIERALDEADVPASKLPAIQAAALAACDSLDGVKDGLIEESARLPVRSGRADVQGRRDRSVPHGPQVITLRQIYEGPRHPRTGRVRSLRAFRPGPRRSRVAGCPGSFRPTARPRRRRWRPSVIAGFGNSFYGQAVAEDPKWDFRTWNFETDLAFAVEKTGGITQFDESRPAIVSRGGREADSVSRLGGCGDSRRSCRSSTTIASAPSWRSTRTDGTTAPRAQDRVLPSLHGTGDGALRRRHRAEHVRQRRTKRRESDGRSRSRHPCRARALGGAQRRTRSHHCQRQSGTATRRSR